MKFNLNFKQKYGIGNSTEFRFKQLAGINLCQLKNRKTYLPNKLKTFFNKKTNKIVKEMKLIKLKKLNIDFHKNLIESYRGNRHLHGYPVRGQRTHTNSTRKVIKLTKYIQ